MRPTIRIKPTLEALGAGVSETYFIVEQTLGYITRIFAGKASTDQLGGPIKIAQVVNQAAQSESSLLALIHLTAFLSVSIGLINLFPIPILDGGHLAFYAVEALR